jgi:hypothetical protein
LKFCFEKKPFFELFFPPIFLEFIYQTADSEREREERENKEIGNAFID